MSEMVGSAIAGEAVSRVFSGLISKYEVDPDETGNVERLEMAHIKMEAAIEISTKWQITDVPLLRWRKKLKRASSECKHMVRESKRRSQEDRDITEQIKQSSLPRRIAHATRSFMSSFAGHKNDECSSKAIVRRFERLADGADDFLRFMQLGGTPRPYMFFDPLIGHLFAGKSVRYQMLQHHGGKYHYFCIQPMSFEERGLEAMLAFIHEDCKMPKNNFRLIFMVRLYESIDIIGIAAKCLQLVPPHFKSAADIVIKELTQLPTQDFSCLPRYDSYNMEHWNNVHNTLTQWFRPDPLCCKGYELHNMPATCSSSSSSANKLRLLGIFPEPVIGFFLQCHISPSEYRNLQDSVKTRYNTSSREDFLPLKMGVLFMPHDPVEDIKFTTEAECSAIEAIVGEKHQIIHVNVHLRQLDELVLPKAIEYLHHNAEAMIYQMSWKSTHGSAHLCVAKTSIEMLGASIGTVRQGWRNKFMGLVEGEWGMEKVMDLGMTAQRVVSFLLVIILVHTTFTSGQLRHSDPSFD